MKTIHRARRRAAGFTLIETLIVLLILAIMLTLVLPNFLKAIQHQKLLGTAQQTAILMRLARLQAIKTASNTVVKIDTAKGMVTAFSDPNNNQTLDSTEKTLGIIELSKGVTFLAVSGFTSPPTPAVAIFRGDGSTAAAGTFQFQSANGDQIEACVMSAAKGNIVLMKYNATTSLDLGCGAGWQPNGEGAKAWKWK